MIEFKLFAPYNEKSLLLGDFSDWEGIPMQKGEDGYFRVTVELPDGNHQYKFRVQSKSWFYPENEWIEIIDPYATEVDEVAQCGILRVQAGQVFTPNYAWQHDENLLPPDHELVIYEMHVGDFSGGEADPFVRGKYADVTDKLDYLTELGINAIELMPVKEFPGEQSWGYNPKFFFAPESSYGPIADLKKLVDECHGRGIRVFIDGVYNHANTDVPLAQIDHDYWFHHEPKDKEFTWGPQFNYEHYDERLQTYPARQFIGDSVRYWIREFHLDGIRYDAVSQIDNYEFLDWIVKETKQTAGAKPFYNVAECIPIKPDITGLHGPMDGTWHDPFKHTVVAYLCTGNVDYESLKNALDARRIGFSGTTNVVNYLANHDHERLLGELGRHLIFDEDAFRRAKLGATMLMTAFGIPMIWMGEEFGEFKPKTSDQNKIDWQHLSQPLNRQLFEHYKHLIALRKSHPALNIGDLSFFHEDHEAQVLGYQRWTNEGDVIMVVLNLSAENLSSYHLPHIPSDGIWHELTSGFKAEAQDHQLILDLPAGSGLIWSLA